MKKNDNDSNLYLSHDLLEKVMDARGGKISPITLGGKNTLIEAYRTARKLNINDNSTPSDRNEIINKIIFSAAKSDNKLLFNLANGCVLKGQG